MWRHRPKKLILLLESTYSRLREQNPDRDEHWLLANTWLARYGSSEQAKEKGAAWARYVAYKDTLQFSILETPKSIKALALFLVYKELGEKAAAHYADEYAQLYEKVYTCMSNNKFIDEYKKRNPQTWSENQVDDGSPYNLYWIFRGMEFRDEHPEKAEEVMRQMNLGDE
jgi:hypothetical protein